MYKQLRLPLDFSDNYDTEQDILNIARELYYFYDTDDVIELYCAGNGGLTSHSNIILNALATCRATIIVIVDSVCYSAHANIALSNFVDEIKIYPIGIEFMLHDMQISRNFSGTARSLELAKRDTEYSKIYYSNIGILDLLSQEEEKDFWDNKEIYFDAVSAQERLKNRATKEFERVYGKKTQKRKTKNNSKISKKQR